MKRTLMFLGVITVIISLSGCLWWPDHGGHGHGGGRRGSVQMF